MKKTNEEALKQIARNLQILENTAILKQRLIRRGMMRDNKPYLSLFQYGDQREYLNDLDLPPAALEMIEQAMQELYDITPDSEFLIIKRVPHEGEMLATCAIVDYDAMRFINQQGIVVRVDFSLSSSNDDLSEGPMTDVYYELDSLIVQGV